MSWYKAALDEEKKSPYKTPPSTFADMFGDDWDKDKPDYGSEEETRMPPEQETITMELYRGFDYLPDPNQDGSYTLDPEKSEGKTLWFTSNLVGVNFAKEFAQDMGKYFIVYKIPITKHTQTIVHTNKNNGESRTTKECPEEIKEKADPYENSKYLDNLFFGYELPEGFYFSYKVQKHIICDIPITVTKDMIKLSDKQEQALT